MTTKNPNDALNFTTTSGLLDMGRFIKDLPSLITACGERCIKDEAVMDSIKNLSQNILREVYGYSFAEAIYAMTLVMVTAADLNVQATRKAAN